MIYTANVDCPEKCQVPEGFTMHDFPRPRHAWRDVIICPHAECGRCFLLVKEPHESNEKAR
jgi:hypothetical protein